ncbi:hypothetical protein CH063_06259, partial [Colletotrichum higginsianum]
GTIGRLPSSTSQLARTHTIRTWQDHRNLGRREVGITPVYTHFTNSRTGRRQRLKNLSICEARLACDLPPLQQMTMQRISNGGDFPFFLSFSYLLSYLSFSDVNSYGEFTAHNGTTTSYCLHFRDPALGSDWRPRRGFENWLSRHQGRASHQSHFFLPSHHRQRGSLHQLYHRRGEGQPGVSFFR